MSLKRRLNVLVERSPFGPALVESGQLAGRRLQRLTGPLRGRYNDAASLLGARRVSEPMSESLRRIVAPQRTQLQQPLPANAPRVLIASGYGLSDIKLVFEAIFGMALRLRGARPIALSCDATLSACEFNPLGCLRPAPWAFTTPSERQAAVSSCTTCINGSMSMFRAAEVEVATLARYAREDDLTRLAGIADGVPYADYRAYVYRDVEVGQHAFASMLRATLRGTLLDTPATRWLFRRYLVSAMHVVDLAHRAFADLRPDHLIAIHGVYVTHGTLCETARRAGIHVVVYGMPYRKGTVWLSHDDTYHRTLTEEPHEAWENTPLSVEQNAQLDAYLDSKRGGGRDYVSYHPRPVEDAAHIASALQLDRRRPIITLFTNVLWDAQIYYGYNAFPDMLAWLDATIARFAARPELQLVVRVHPAEVKGGMPTCQPILAELHARHPRLPENVRVVPPESDISSYTLAEMSRATLIYGTKMGLEIAVRGVPVVVAGDTFNRGKGFTYDVETAAAYDELLARIETLPRNSPAMVERARRYANYLFFRRMMDFPLVSVEDPHYSRGLRLEFASLDALQPEADRTLDTICGGILRGTPFVL